MTTPPTTTDAAKLREAIDGVLDEVKSAVMTQNMELKKRLNQAAELLKDFPGHRDETEWNAWLFKRDRFISKL